MKQEKVRKHIFLRARPGSRLPLLCSAESKPAWTYRLGEKFI